MPTEVLDNTKERMNKTIAVLQQELSSLRAGRANPQVLERIMVDYYGSPTPINQLGNISVPEPRLLVIAAWDNKAIPAIEKAIQKSDLGINPQGDPVGFPRVDGGAPQGSRKGCQKKGGGEQGCNPCHPPRCKRTYQGTEKGQPADRGRPEAAGRKDPEDDRRSD